MPHERYHTGVEEMDKLRFRQVRLDRTLRMEKIYPLRGGFIGVHPNGQLYATNVEKRYYAGIPQLKMYVIRALFALGKLSAESFDKLHAEITECNKQDKINEAAIYVHRYFKALDIKLTKAQQEKIVKQVAKGWKSGGKRPKGAG